MDVTIISIKRFVVVLTGFRKLNLSFYLLPITGNSKIYIIISTSLSSL